MYKEAQIHYSELGSGIIKLIIFDYFKDLNSFNPNNLVGVENDLNRIIPKYIKDPFNVTKIDFDKENNSIYIEWNGQDDSVEIPLSYTFSGSKL